MSAVNIKISPSSWTEDTAKPLNITHNKDQDWSEFVQLDEDDRAFVDARAQRLVEEIRSSDARSEVLCRNAFLMLKTEVLSVDEMVKRHEATVEKQELIAKQRAEARRAATHDDAGLRRSGRALTQQRAAVGSYKKLEDDQMDIDSSDEDAGDSEVESDDLSFASESDEDPLMSVPASSGPVHKVKIDKLELFSTDYKRRFLELVAAAAEELTAVSTASMSWNFKTPGGVDAQKAVSFNSTNDGRYFFHHSGHLEAFGGAEVLGTEDKRLGTSSSKASLEKLRNQTAGQMIATGWQRRIGILREWVLSDLRETQPEYDSSPGARDTTIYFVFAHLTVYMVVAEIPDEYLVQLHGGYLRPEDSLEFRWSRGFDLACSEDFEEASTMILGTFVMLQRQWLRGDQFWRPFKIADKLVRV